MSGLIALLVLSLFVGVLARRAAVFPERTPEVLNAVILNVALPAMVLRVLHEAPLSASLFVAASMLWLQFLLAIGLFFLLARALKLSRGTMGALILTGGLSNTAFVGLPVIEAVYGQKALGVAVVIDQLGAFLLVATLGVIVASALGGKSTRPGVIAKKVLLFPPFLALLAAFALRGLDPPAWSLTTLERLGAMLTPLALISVGYQLRVEGLRERLGALGLGLGFKLVLAPVVFGALFSLFAPPHSLEWKVTVLQCAMPPMVTGGILASQNQLDPPLAALMVGVGIPLSALTLAAAVHFMG